MLSKIESLYKTYKSTKGCPRMIIINYIINDNHPGVFKSFFGKKFYFDLSFKILDKFDINFDGKMIVTNTRLHQSLKKTTQTLSRLFWMLQCTLFSLV